MVHFSQLHGPKVPSTHPPNFEVETSVPFVPINGLAFLHTLHCTPPHCNVYHKRCMFLHKLYNYVYYVSYILCIIYFISYIIYHM